MPIYEYHCSACGADFESIRPVSRADDPTECKSCRQPATRQISNFFVQVRYIYGAQAEASPREAFRGNRAADSTPEQPQPTDSPAD